MLFSQLYYGDPLPNTFYQRVAGLPRHLLLRGYRNGKLVKLSLTPEATIGVHWAGVAPYFSDRQFVDLLGRSDRHIAKISLPTIDTVIPAHSKWDWDYIVNVRKPDVLIGISRGLVEREDFRRNYWRVENEHTFLFFLRKDAIDLLTSRVVLLRDPSDGETIPASEHAFGRFLVDRGRLEEGIAHLRRAVSDDPADAQARIDLAVVLSKAKQLSESVAHYTEALSLDPDAMVALNNLAWIRATSPDPELRDPGDAVRLAEEGCALTGYRDPEMLLTLAVALASDNRVDASRQRAQDALELSRGDSRMFARIQQFEDWLAVEGASEQPQLGRSFPDGAKPGP